MSNRLIIAVALVLTLATCERPAVAEPIKKIQIDKSADDDKIIRAQAEEYKKEFALADAKAIASKWTEDGIYIDIDGNEYHGRSEIEKLYTRYFHDHGKQTIELSIDSIRFPACDVAIEEGTTHLTNSSSTAIGSKYILVHVKKDGLWQISTSTETHIKPITNAECMKDLSWLIGTWTPLFAKDKVLLKMKWLGNYNFINCTFALPELTTEEISDDQVIGWDPVRQQPTSWNFSATGGYGRALWIKDGDSWILCAHSVQSDGSTGLATYILHKLDNDTFTWRSVRRSIDGCSLPDTPEIKIVRENKISTDKSQ